MRSVALKTKNESQQRIEELTEQNAKLVESAREKFIEEAKESKEAEQAEDKTDVNATEAVVVEEPEPSAEPATEDSKEIAAQLEQAESELKLAMGAIEKIKTKKDAKEA